MTKPDGKNINKLQNYKEMKRALLLFLILITVNVFSQYAPAAGQEGSTAISADSSVFIEWAKNCDVTRGYLKISDTSMGYVSYGNTESALGTADNNVVSLGDGGYAVLTFEHPVTNGNGWDFAVFENSFDDNFLELAFVEVSSDGETFYRFPSSSLTQTEEQVESFGTIDPTKINNLAGKYRVMFGTPFDLEELKNKPGLNVNHIIAIKVEDVTGCIMEEYASHDSEGHIINDPWPTPFESGGFDLDAIGVIHNTTNTSVNAETASDLLIYPNPCSNFINVKGDIKKIIVRDISGRVLNTSENNQVNASRLKPGLLIIEVINKKNIHSFYKVLKK